MANGIARTPAPITIVETPSLELSPHAPTPSSLHSLVLTKLITLLAKPASPSKPPTFFPRAVRLIQSDRISKDLDGYGLAQNIPTSAVRCPGRANPDGSLLLHDVESTSRMR